MIRKYLLPLLALIGIIFSIYSVIASNKPVPVVPPVALPAQAPFASYIAGAGIIEASTENIALGAALPGIVMKVHVTVGKKIKLGDALFTIDDRDLKAELEVKKAMLKIAREKLLRLESLPRAEDIPLAEAKIKEARVSYLELKNQLTLAESVTDKRAISVEELNRRKFATQAAEARLDSARAQLDLLKAGSWQPDIALAKAEIMVAQSQLKVIETNLERLTVKSPMDGEILQLNLRPGEYAPIGITVKPLVLLGNLDRLHVRVDIDENDAWRFKKELPAIAFVRGNSAMKTDLQYEKTEPYVVPKKSLTGESTERVDTRVMQIIYSFARYQLPVYAGQQMDIFIEAPALEQIASEIKQEARENK